MREWSVLAGAASLAACGRLGFPTTIDAPPTIDTPPTTIEWVQVFAAPRPEGSGADHSFTGQAKQAGDAVVLLVACAGAAKPTSVSLSAAGWSFEPLGPIIGTAPEWAASFGAIAPDTTSAVLTVSWTGSSCEIAQAELADEFANTDPTGGKVTFDMHAEATGTGDASASVTTGNANDAVWAACVSSGTLTEVGPGYEKGADNSTGDWSEHRITSDAAGHPEPVQFRNANVNEYALTAVTIKPR